MKTLLTTLVLIVFVAFNALSQDTKGKARMSEIQKNKNQIDLDIKNIFNGLGNATLLYKRAIKNNNDNPSKEAMNLNTLRLIRFSGSINNQFSFTDDPSKDPNDTTISLFHPTNVIDMRLGVGFETQKIHKNFTHYYGIDGIFEIIKYDDDFPISRTGLINTAGGPDRYTRVLRAGVHPFFGIKYYFTSNISLGIETGLSLVYFHQAITEVGFEERVLSGQIIQVFVEREPVKSEGFRTTFNNLKLLTVGYAF